MKKSPKEIMQETMSKAISYSEYRNLVTRLAEEGRSTGPEQTDALTNYTQLNDKRMKRWDKTFKINEEAAEIIRKVDQKATWLVLTESWCGDASPALPVMNKITELNPNITLKIILRDENIAIMNMFLTNGSMSIPKLISINEIGEPENSWGPRSKKATKLVEDYKAKYGVLTPEFKQDLQLWYNKDKGYSILEDLLVIFPFK